MRSREGAAYRSRVALTGLVNAGADLTTLAAETDTTALEQVGHGGYGFTIVLRVAAHRDDQVAQTVVGAIGLFQVLFHRSCWGKICGRLTI